MKSFWQMCEFVSSSPQTTCAVYLALFCLLLATVVMMFFLFSHASSLALLLLVFIKE